MVMAALAKTRICLDQPLLKGNKMQFVLTFKQPPDIYERNADPVEGPVLLSAWKDYMDAMASAGVMRGGQRLDAMGATVVRMRDGVRQVQDGPYIDSKELLGGFVVIDVASVDDAIKWAALSPSSATGHTGIWPVVCGPA
jgi:hypothetical protein